MISMAACRSRSLGPGDQFHRHALESISLFSRARFLPTPRPAAPEQRRARIVRWLLIVAGALSLALALVGMVLPLLPTVPFLLLTAACWSRASPRWHRWLLSRPRLGPAIARWERERTVPRRAKLTAIALIVPSMTASIWLVRNHAWLPWVLAGVAVLVILFILRLPETRDGA
jgi:uncharacterized membrane protein YbaN (DUF454 family)